MNVWRVETWDFLLKEDLKLFFGNDGNFIMALIFYKINIFSGKTPSKLKLKMTFLTKKQETSSEARRQTFYWSELKRMGELATNFYDYKRKILWGGK